MTRIVGLQLAKIRNVRENAILQPANYNPALSLGSGTTVANKHWNDRPRSFDLPKRDEAYDLGLYILEWDRNR